MRAHEFIIERKKRRKRPKWAAYGPGPYGGYGFFAGYSGDGGDAGDGGGVGEDVLKELNVSQTLQFIKKAHGDQLYGKLPYWTHPRAVALTGKKIFGSKFNSNAIKVAFLHDVVEDTDVGLDELSKLGFDPIVINAVGLLTKDKTLGYSQNIERIIKSGNSLAMMVKYADNYENYTGDKSDWDPKRASASQKKYLMSLNMLGDKLGVKHHVGEDFTDEGWKDWAAAGALGTALALGSSSDVRAAKPKSQDIVKQISQKELAKTVTGNPHEVILKKTAEKSGIQGQELVAFLAQAAHETLDFKHMKEIGGSLDFKKYDIKYAPKKAKALGNTKPGDGAKYKGRGYIQLTGKYNYKRAGEALGLDLVNKPELVEKPEIAAMVAVWYWKERVRDKVADFTDTKSVTKPINPGLKHLDQRSDKYQAFRVAMR